MATKKDDKDTTQRASQGNGGEAARASDKTRRAATEAVESSVQAGTKMVERAMAEASEAGRRSSEQIRSMTQATARVYRDMAEFTPADVDAFMQSGMRIAKGMQDISWEMMQFTQDSLRMSLQAANQMMTCRTIEDLMEIQRSYFKESMDTFLQEGVRLMEISSNMTTGAVTAERAHLGE